jgi:hypothetical protein
VTLSRFSEEVGEQGIYTGFYGGLFGEYAFGRAFALQPEVLYSRYGGNLGNIMVGRNGDTRNRLDYLNVALIGKVALMRGLTLDLGPEYARLLVGKEITTWEDGGPPKKDDITYRMRANDFYVAMGFTYRATRRLDVSVRYDLGLVKQDDAYGYKNNVIRIGAGFRF